MGSGGSRIEPGVERLSRLTVVFASFLLIVSVIPLTPTAAVIEKPDLVVAVSAAPATAAPTSVTGTDIAGALTQAKSDWVAIVPTADLSAATASGADLGGLQLASTSGTRITVDIDAAGWGWSVSFPDESGHMSLVTVLRHELGHVLGLDHQGGVMSATLSPDEVRSITASDGAPLTSEPAAEPADRDGEGEARVEDPVLSLDVSASSLDAGTVPMGSGSVVTVDLSNAGTSVLVISEVSISGNAAFSTTASELSLGPDETATVSVSFVPTGTGPVSAMLDITSGGGDASVALSGTGTDPEPSAETSASAPTPVLEVSAVSLDTGTITLGGSSTATVDISNTGTATLVITEILISGDTAFTTSATGFTLEPGESATVAVGFVPTVASEVLGTLAITSDGGYEAIALTGTGTVWSTSGGSATALVLDGRRFDHSLRFDGSVVQLVDASGAVDALDTSGLTDLTLVGGSGDDTLRLDTAGASVLPVVFDGGDGEDTLSVPAAIDARFDITGINAGTYQPADGSGPWITFANIENLNGAATAADTFEFDPGAGVTGVITDGAGDLTVGVAGFVQVNGDYDFDFMPGYLARIAGTETDVSSTLLTLGGSVGTGFVGVEPLDNPVGVSGALGEFGLAIVTTSARAWHAFEGTLVSAQAVGVDELNLDITSLVVTVNDVAQDGTYLDMSGNTISIATGGVPITLDSSVSVVAASAPLVLEVDGILHGAGTFTFGVTGTTLVDVSTGLLGPSDVTTSLAAIPVATADPGTAIARTDDFSTIWNLPTRGLTLAATGVSVFLGSNFQWSDDNADGIIQESELASGATGFLASHIDIGLAMMSPTTTGIASFDASSKPTFCALKGKASFLDLINLPDFELSSSGVAVEVNRGTRWPGAEPVVDWESSFVSGFSIPTGGAPVDLDLSGSPVIGISADNMLMSISDFVHVAGSFSVRAGPVVSVDVRTGLPEMSYWQKLQVFGTMVSSAADPADGSLARTPEADWIWNLPVRTLEFGMTDVDVFVGYVESLDIAALDGDLSVGELESAGAIGLFHDEITVGMALMTALQVDPGLSTALNPYDLRFFALQANTDNVTLVGIPEITLDATATEVRVNGSMVTYNILTPWPGLNEFSSPPVIDYVSSFPANPPAPAGYAVRTGTTSDPVYLTFETPLIGASAEQVSIQVSHFVYITGSMSFAMGPVETVQLVDAAIDTSLIDAIADDLGLTAEEKAWLGLTEKELQFFTIGGYHAHAFVGLGGPYWVDTNGNGIIDRYTSGSRAGQIVDEETSPYATGLVLDNFDFGMAYMSPTNWKDLARYLALSASASKVALVGPFNLRAGADNVLVELNISTPDVLGMSVLPVVNFCSEWTGSSTGDCVGFGVITGARDPMSGGDIVVNLTMDAFLVRAIVPLFQFDVLGVMTLVGNFAFERGPTTDVALITLDGSPGTDTVTTMTVGASGVFGLIGWDNPVFRDGNGNGQIDVDSDGIPLPGEFTSEGIGIALNDLDLGLFFGLSTSLIGPNAYFAMGFSADSLSFWGLDFLSADATMGVHINVGGGFSPGVGIDFKDSFLDDDSRCERGPPDVGCNDGLLVATGDPSNPVLLDFDSFLFNIEMVGELVMRPDGHPDSDPMVAMLGTFFLEVEGFSFKVLASADLRLGFDIGSGVDPMLDISTLGVIVLNLDGFAADLDVAMDARLTGLGLGTGVSARLILNITGVDQRVEIPKRLIDRLTESSNPLASDLLARLEYCDPGDPEAGLCYTISAFAPDISDATTVETLLHNPAWAVENPTTDVKYTSSRYYVVGVIGGTFEFLGFTSGHGSAGLQVSPDLFHLHVDLSFDIGIVGAGLKFTTHGVLELSPDGLYGDTGVAIGMDLFSMITMDVSGTLTIDMRASDRLFELHLAGDLTAFFLVEIDGSLDIEVGVEGEGTWRGSVAGNGTFAGLSFASSGWIQSDGQLSLDISGSLEIGSGALGISGSVAAGLSVTKSGTNYVYADSDTYTFNVFMRGGVVFTILGVGFGGSLGIDVTSVFGVDSSATLRANACVVILKVRYCATATIATIAIPTTIFPDQPPPQLATMNSGGTLRLNVGDTASERTVSTEGADEDYEIRQVGGNATNGYTIKVLAFGYAEEYSGVWSIEADFGFGDDSLMVHAGVAVSVDVNGGTGNDVLSYLGVGEAVLKGGPGNDTLIGGSGSDTLVGGSGSDFLDGRGDIDTLVGGTGDDIIFGSIADLVGETPDGGDGTDIVEVHGTPGADAFVLTAAGDHLRLSYGVGGHLTIQDVESMLLIPNGGADAVDLIGDLRSTGILTINVSLIEAIDAADAVTVTLLDSHDTLTVSGADASPLVSNIRTSTDLTITVPDGLTVPTGRAEWAGKYTAVVSATDSLDSININTLGGADDILVPSLVSVARIEGGDGADRVAVGSHASVTSNTGGTLEAIGAMLTVIGGLGADSLSIDDSGETSGQVGTLTGTLLTGFGLPDGGIAYSGIARLDLFLGQGGDSLSVLSTAGSTTTRVDAGPGADTVHVSSDAPTGLGDLHALAGALSLVGGSGADALYVSDAGDGVGDSGTLSAAALTGFGTAGIVYETFEVLEVNLGTGADAITVESTHSGTTLIVGGDGADTFDIRTIDGRTEVRGAVGDDTFRIGSVMPTPGGLLDEIDALLVIDGGPGIDDAIIDDSGDTDDNLGTLTQTTLFGLDMGSGVSQTGGISYYGFGANEKITILLGSGSDRFNVRGTTASTRLETRDGDDVVYVSDSADLSGLPTALAAADGDLAVLNDLVLHGTVTVDGLTFHGSLNLIVGALDIETGPGSNTLAVSDKADPDPDTNVTITDASITGLAPAVISYSATNGDLAGQGAWTLPHDGGLFGRGITVYGGGGGNTFTITSVLGSDMTPSPFSATVTSLFAGAGVDSVDISVADGVARRLVIRGEDGDDTITGAPIGLAESALSLTIFGDDGYDTLIGGSNDDRLFGDDARVYYRVSSSAIGWDLVFGGAPSVGDLVHPLTGVVLTADAGFLTPEVLLTGATVIGMSGAGATPLTGDVIDGRDGNDLIFGGAAADVVRGGGGNDLMFGDFGWVGGNYDATALPLSMPIASHPFEFISTDITDTNAASDILYGGAGHDIILGQQGADTIFGGADDDDLFGGHNFAGGHDTGDVIDGGSGHDVIVGDSAIILRTGSETTILVRALMGGLLYGGVTSTPQRNPTGVEARFVALLNHSKDTASNLFGDDIIAGGDDDDVIFGQLGSDIIHGDGMITDAGNHVETTATTATDGDDYIEGGGGNDAIYGGLGQDDIIGGSSDLFGLTSRSMRPDGVDTIYGGNGDAADRNDEGDVSESGHARDADVILGDNGRILRIVGTNGIDSGAFETFSYDTYGIDTVIPRSVMLLDYSPYGGTEYWSTEPPIHPSAPELISGSRTNIGDGDFIHGEAGDDVIHGMTGNDALFGDGQDDDIYGEEGYDWISGGAGDDGILGDDGLLLTSRNGTAESLYGIAATTERIISTPGHRQSAVINVERELARAVDLEPFWIGHNDVIYGGLGNDFIHAGMGDDAVSGAEALGFYYVNDPLALLADLYEVGNVLQYNFRAGSSEFAYYDRSDPFRQIHLRTVPGSGEFLEDGSGNRIDFLLNFEARITPSDPYSVIDDGKDTIFGDGGNDWIVGGTGHDRMFGGWGDDLLQADDDLDSTLGSGDDDANNIPDASTSAVTFADIAYGGAGRDILIANTTADRLIDWVGQFNSYVVPFRSQGAPTISRSPSRHIIGYLYALSAGSGIDLTRGGDTSRNGEPHGELGLVTQKDDDWKAQTRKPADTPKSKDKSTKGSGDEAATLFAQDVGNQTIGVHDASEPDVVSRHPGDADVEPADTSAKPGRGRGRQRIWTV